MFLALVVREELCEEAFVLWLKEERLETASQDGFGDEPAWHVGQTVLHENVITCASLSLGITGVPQLATPVVD